MIILISKILVDHGNNVSREEFSPDSCQDLAISIETNGLLQPVMVVPIEHEDYEFKLVLGYRRIVACSTILGWLEIEATVRYDLSEDEARILNLAENIQRQNLSYWEECQALFRTFDLEMSDLAISKVVGKSRGWVRNRWALWRLPQEVIDQVGASLLSAADVNMLLAKSPEEQIATAEAIIRGKEQGETTQQLAERLSRRKAVRPQKDIRVMMNVLMEAGHNEAMHALRYTVGEITDTQLLEIIK